MKPFSAAEFLNGKTQWERLRIERIVYSEMLIIFIQDERGRNDNVYLYEEPLNKAISISRPPDLYLLMKRSSRKRWDDISFFNFNFDNKRYDEKSLDVNVFPEIIFNDEKTTDVTKETWEEYNEKFKRQLSIQMNAAGIKHDDFSILRKKMLSEFAFPLDLFRVEPLKFDEDYFAESKTQPGMMTHYRFRFYLVTRGDKDQIIKTIADRYTEGNDPLVRILREDFSYEFRDMEIWKGKDQMELRNCQNRVITDLLKKEVCQPIPVDFLKPSVFGTHTKHWKFHTVLHRLVANKEFQILLAQQRAKLDRSEPFSKSNSSDQELFNYIETPEPAGVECAIFIDLYRFRDVFHEVNARKSHLIQKVYLQDIVSILEKFNCHVEMFAGDGLFATMAFQEKQAGMHIVKMIEQLLAQVWPIRIGIASTRSFPDLYEGLLAPLHYKKSTFSGKAVNISARLEQKIKEIMPKKNQLYHSAALILNESEYFLDTLRGKDSWPPSGQWELVSLQDENIPELKSIPKPEAYLMWSIRSENKEN